MTEERTPSLAELKAYAHADYVEQLGDAQKRLDFSVGYAQAGIKALFLVNGTAILALLTFLGNGGDLHEPRAIFWAFVWFTCGVTAVLIAYFGAYFSQAYYMQVSIAAAWNAQAVAHDIDRRFDGTSDRVKGDLANKIAILGAIGGLAFFIVGAFVALDAIT